MSESIGPRTEPVKVVHKRKDDRNRYSLTFFTKALIAFVLLIVVASITGLILYLSAQLNDARQQAASQTVAISEWSRRYLSLYNEYQSKTGTQPIALPPQSVQYLINTQTKSTATTADAGTPFQGSGLSAPVSWSYEIKGSDGKVRTITCSEAPKFDPQKPVYVCK